MLHSDALVQVPALQQVMIGTTLRAFRCFARRAFIARVPAWDRLFPPMGVIMTYNFPLKRLTIVQQAIAKIATLPITSAVFIYPPLLHQLVFHPCPF